MRQEQMQRRKYRTPRRRHRDDVLALDPRDPDVVRVKAQARATASGSTSSAETSGFVSSSKRLEDAQLLTLELQQRRWGRWVTIGLRPAKTRKARVVAEWLDGRSRLVEWT